VIDNHPPPQQTLPKKFLGEILASIDDMKLNKLPSNPTEALKSLLCLSTHQILWDALREVLSKAVELYTHPTVLEQHDAQQNERSLTFIFNLDNSAVEIGRTLVSDIRRLTASLRQDHPKQSPCHISPSDKRFRAGTAVGDYPDIRQRMTRSADARLLFHEQIELSNILSNIITDFLKNLRFNNTPYEMISAHYEHTFEWLWENLEFHASNSSSVPKRPGRPPRKSLQIGRPAAKKSRPARL
jgi:hypothetical protein